MKRLREKPVQEHRHFSRRGFLKQTGAGILVATTGVLAASSFASACPQPLTVVIPAITFMSRPIKTTLRSQFEQETGIPLQIIESPVFPSSNVFPLNAEVADVALAPVEVLADLLKAGAVHDLTIFEPAIKQAGLRSLKLAQGVVGVSAVTPPNGFGFTALVINNKRFEPQVGFQLCLKIAKALDSLIAPLSETVTGFFEVQPKGDQFVASAGNPNNPPTFEPVKLRTESLVLRNGTRITDPKQDFAIGAAEVFLPFEVRPIGSNTLKPKIHCCCHIISYSWEFGVEWNEQAVNYSAGDVRIDLKMQDFRVSA